MKNIQIADLSLLTSAQQENMLPDKVAVFDSLAGIGLENYFNLQGAILILVEKGGFSVELNLSKYKVTEKSLIVGLPDQIARITEMSKDFKFICIACSRKMFDDLMVSVSNSIPMLLLVRQKPILQPSKAEYASILYSFQYVRSKLKERNPNPCIDQIVKSAVATLAYECIGSLMKTAKPNLTTTKKEAHCNAFINLVTKMHKKEHSVTYYARELFVSPKYLSTVVEKISGKCAKRWIDEFIALEAKTMLCSTNKSIQDISDELFFPNISFFGKFFKRVVGLSPKAYRDQANKPT